MTTIEFENQAGKQGARKHRFAAVGQALAAVQRGTLGAEPSAV
ncbi:hypothetical protein [Devosia psychrophila]|uniref:Uncharacterized protein n=1 Tax=Devosia psychrophila TaxID=728005 RepID=A0A1I1H954_9HYPH|nr:hypothetical protein [Devosia psychrophila]SFC20112.1 hypothetical protein SAMN04488059_1031 [Devosia psychrophila]